MSLRPQQSTKMPGKNNKQNKKQRQQSKRRRPTNAGMGLTGPFPAKRAAKLRYVDSLTLTEGGAGAGATYGFTPTSLYDPNNTGAGHQPMYYDQLCSSSGPYTCYRTFATSAKITFINTTTTPCFVGWYVSPTGSAPASQIQACEKPWGRWRWLGSKDGSSGILTERCTIPHGKALGVTRRHLEMDDYYSGVYNSSPSKNYFLVVYVYGTTGVASINFTVELVIDSEFFSLTNTGTS